MILEPKYNRENHLICVLNIYTLWYNNLILIFAFLKDIVDNSVFFGIKRPCLISILSSLFISIIEPMYQCCAILVHNEMTVTRHGVVNSEYSVILCLPFIKPFLQFKISNAFLERFNTMFRYIFKSFV